MNRRDYDRAKRRCANGLPAKPATVRIVCESCTRPIGTYTPRKGDGSLDYYYDHNTPAGERCPLANRPVPSQE